MSRPDELAARLARLNEDALDQTGLTDWVRLARDAVAALAAREPVQQPVAWRPDDAVKLAREYGGIGKDVISIDKADLVELVRHLQQPPTGYTLIPTRLAIVLNEWSGEEPSQSALAREVDRWLAPQPQSTASQVPAAADRPHPVAPAERGSKA